MVRLKLACGPGRYLSGEKAALIPMHRMMLTVCSVVTAADDPAALCRAAPVVRGRFEQESPHGRHADNGKAQGIMIDIVEEIARQEGWTPSLCPLHWSNVLEDLENAKNRSAGGYRLYS